MTNRRVLFGQGTRPRYGLVAVAKQSAVDFDRDFDAHSFGYTASCCVRNFSGDAFADSHGLLLLDRFAYRVGNLFRPNFFHHFADGVGNRLGLLFLDHVADAIGDGLDLLFLDHVADAIGDGLDLLFLDHVADTVGDGLDLLLLDGVADAVGNGLDLLFLDGVADTVWDGFDLLFLDHVADTVGDGFGTFFFHHFADGVGDLFLDGLPFITYAFDLFLLNLGHPDFLADLAWCTFNLDDSTGARFENVAATL